VPKSPISANPKFSIFNPRLVYELQNLNSDRIIQGNLEMLLKVLTPRRLKLLGYLRGRGAISIRKLSQELARDYSNIYKDVKKLKICGLIEENPSLKIYVPWIEMITRFYLKDEKLCASYYFLK
jgi:hypothetical protein